MKTEFELLTDEQLLEEIKRQWYDKGMWDHEKFQQYGYHPWSIADDYFSGDVEEHIEALEREYTSRGFELPKRNEYVAQFLPDESEE